MQRSTFARSFVALVATTALVGFALSANAGSHKDKDTKKPADDAQYIQFEIDHAKKGNLVKGGFTKFMQVSGKVDTKNLAASKAVFEVDITSIGTGNPKRDGHLKSADFFNTAKWAKAKFTVDKVKKTKAGHTANVTLEMVGAKKSFGVSFSIVRETKKGVLIEGSTTIKRADYKLGGPPAKSNVAESAMVKVRLMVHNK